MELINSQQIFLQKIKLIDISTSWEEGTSIGKNSTSHAFGSRGRLPTHTLVDGDEYHNISMSIDDLFSFYNS